MNGSIELAVDKMKKKVIIFTLTCLFFFLLPLSYCFSESTKNDLGLLLASSSDEFDDMEESDDYGDEEEDESAMEFFLAGSVELETFINTYEDQDFQDAIKKNELRGRFEIRYGLENIYLYSVANLYFMPLLFKDDTENDYRYAEKAAFSRNLRTSSQNSEIIFSELYLSYSTEDYRIRIGNQIYGWGTSDTYNPTSYFNPMDGRELLFKDMDEMNSGIPSVSGMVFLDDYTIEMVVAPIHIPMQIAPTGNFWAPKMDSLFKISFEETDGLDISFENVGIGIRLSGSFFNADMSFSAFHGPDKDGVPVPYATELFPNEQILILIQSQYDVINMLGMDFSKTIGAFVLQCETAFSNNKPAMVNQDFDDIENVEFPIEVKKTNFFSATLGFNYEIPLSNFFEWHEGMSLFICEYSFSKHFDDDVTGSFLSDLVTMGFRDSFFDDRLSTTLAAIFDAKTGSSVLYPQLGYDFQNGLTISLSYAAISGTSTGDDLLEPMFYYFRDNDLIMWKVRYEF